MTGPALQPPQRRRIAWAGPWNGRSAIAAFGERVAAELAARGHDVVVFRTETGELLDMPPRPAPGHVMPLADAPLEVLAREYDAFVVNLGDHYGHHGAAIPALLRFPAVAVFHDAFLANLFNGWLVAGRGDASVAGPVLSALYGAAEAGAPGPFLLPLEEMAARRPMLEWFAALAGGAVVHANHYAERARSACPGPVAVIPLAFEGFAAPPPRPIGPGGVVVATVGHINPNKRVADMLRAMAASEPIRERVRYRLVGPVEPGERATLCGLAQALGVPEPEFTGWVEDADLPRRLADVDAICCLRNPVLEGASASLILAMRSGRPVLVSDHGPYADVPDGLVLKCRPGHEATDARLHLESLLADPAPARAMGARARAYAEATFTAGRYADRLLEHLDRAVEALPAVRAGMGLGRTLAGFGMAPDDPAGHRAAAVLDDLLDRRE